MRRSTLMTLSVLVHAGVAIGLGAIEVHRRHTTTSIEIAETKPPPPKKAEDKPPPPKQPPPPPPRARPRALAAPAPLAANAPTPAFGNLPDFGLSLEGGVSAGGIPIAMAPVAAAAAPPPVVKQLSAAVLPLAKKACVTAPSKPKPLSVPQPAFPEQARNSGVEGKVRVQLSIDETGNVTDVRVLQALGHGFDEAAVAAARNARFAPAEHCGKATKGTFTIAMRFSAG